MIEWVFKRACVRDSVGGHVYVGGRVCVYVSENSVCVSVCVPHYVSYDSAAASSVQTCSHEKKAKDRTRTQKPYFTRIVVSERG